MALQQVLNTDPSSGTASLQFNNPSQVDLISYGSGQITLAAISSFNLSKSDIALYFQFLNAFNNSLFLNFPSIAASVNTAWPLSTFDITTSFAGVKHIFYTQTSQGVVVQTINYVPVAAAGSFIVRASPVTITLQEFFMMVYMMSQFANQVALN